MDADTDDRNVPYLNVDATVEVNTRARMGRGSVFTLYCETRGNDCDERMSTNDRISIIT